MTTKLKVLAAMMTVGVSAGAFLSVNGTVHADDISNSIDGSVDATLETLNLVEGGASGSVQYAVTAKDGDGVDGCNLSADETLTLNVESSNPAVATVSPASLTFTNCTNVETVTVTPMSAGSAEVTLTQTANGSAGFFNISGSAFLAVVADVTPPDTTPPVITYSLSEAPNAAGWNNADVTLTWSVTDPESEITLQTGCDTVTQTEETMGTTFTCSATSAGGVSTESVMIKLDKTAPIIRIASPRDGASYEVDQRAFALWFAADRASGVETATGTKASGERLDTSTAGDFEFTVNATDKAGNTASLTNDYMVKADDDDDDDDDNDGRRRTLCHKGNVSITVSAPAVSAHLRHGDTLGSCDDQNDDD